MKQASGGYINLLMSIHIGEIIQAEVENRKLTYREFGALINKSEKTVPNIYDRPTMTIDLLITISQALQRDFLNIYYQEEPMKSLRNDDVAALQKEVERMKEENERLNRESQLQQDAIEALKGQVSMMKEMLASYKR